jgi:hypothetical protein
MFELDFPKGTRLGPALGACIAALLLSLPEHTARADETEACLAAYDGSQRLRKEGKLAASREQLVLCVRPACPRLVQRDCSQWLSSLDAITPTVIVNARDADGKDVLSVRVLVDGVVLSDKLDGKPHPVDPGVHVFRYEREGASPVEENVVIREGEKGRVINVRLPEPPKVATAPAKRPEVPAGPPVGAYVLLGAAVAGGAAFGVLATLGKNDVDRMRQPGGCAPRCDESDVAAARNEIIAANVSLGVGLVAAGIGTYLLLKPRSSAPELQVGVRALPGGVMTGASYRF